MISESLSGHEGPPLHAWRVHGPSPEVIWYFLHEDERIFLVRVPQKPQSLLIGNDLEALAMALLYSLG
jgi:hypothetical protein